MDHRLGTSARNCGRKRLGIRDVRVDRDRTRAEQVQKMASDEPFRPRNRNRAGHGPTLPAGYRCEMSAIRLLVALAAAALLVPGATPATNQADFLWRPTIRVHGPYDVVGPRAD